MKKIIVLLFIVLLIICNISSSSKDFTLRNYFDGGILYTYTSTPINDTSIYLANSYMSLSRAGTTKSNLLGESICFENLEVGSALNKLKASVKFTEFLEEQSLTVIYAYSNLIPKYEMVNNYKINLQISTCSEYTIIGWPLIYGSF